MELKKDPLATSGIGIELGKTDDRVIFVGKLDSANTDIVLARLYVNSNDSTELTDIITKHMRIMSYVECAIYVHNCFSIDMTELDCLNAKVDELKKNYGFVNSLMPVGNNLTSALLSKARASVREAELLYAKIFETKKSLYSTDENDEIVFEYLNKVSLYLYYLSIKYNN